MTKNIMIDLETLGTNVDSQILSIGACEFDIKTGDIQRTFYHAVKLPSMDHINVTSGTLEFWLSQPNESREVIFGEDVHKVTLLEALKRLSIWLPEDSDVWANGTKFDLGMLEYLYKKHRLPIPWGYNSDRCMRTIRKFAGNLDIDYEGIPHYALDDAIWQAKYVSAACNKLGLL